MDSSPTSKACTAEDPESSAFPPSSLASLSSRDPQDEENSGEILDLAVQKEHSDLIISSLPRRQEGAEFPLVLYQGFWIPEFILPSVMAVQKRFKASPTDVILVTLPKSGTTWLKALAFAIANRSNHSFAQHPLLSRNPHECVPFLELDNDSFRQAASHDDMPATTRLLATHIPYSLLPASVTTDSDCRLVYLCRDPKDVFVSLWHFAKILKPDFMELNQAFEIFCQGVSLSGPVWDHNLEYWRESLRRPDKVLFLKYEELKAEPVKSVKRLAEFMGRPFSEEEERDGVVEEVLRLCSFEKLRSLEVNKSGANRPVGGVRAPWAAFFRKGWTGDWTNHLSGDMAERLNRILQEKLNGSGLSF